MDENTEQEILMARPNVLIEPSPDPRMWGPGVGAESGIKYEEVLADGDWSEFLPDYEDQTLPGFDSVSCVTYSGQNVLEPQLDLMIEKDRVPATALAFLEKHGYLKDGKVNFSDRFSAILSGTTANGNYMTNVPDSFRRDGLIPEHMLPYPDLSDLMKNGRVTQPVAALNRYLNKAVITAEMKALGKEFLKHFNIQYDCLVYGGDEPDAALLRPYLKQAPLHFAATVCTGENTQSVINACGCGASHARVITKMLPKEEHIGIFDSFYKAKKRMARDFCIPYIYRIVITPRTDFVPPAFSHTFAKKMVPESIARTNRAKHGYNDGQEVMKLQQALQILKSRATGKTFLSPEIVRDPNFGPLTQAAVIAYQTDRAVTTPGEIKIANGEAGPLTRKALNAENYSA